MFQMVQQAIPLEHALVNKKCKKVKFFRCWMKRQIYMNVTHQGTVVVPLKIINTFDKLNKLEDCDLHPITIVIYYWGTSYDQQGNVSFLLT